MLKHTLNLHARDLLFFNDARTMGGATEGAGVQWPLPSVLHSAILSAFHERWPELDAAHESQHKHRCDNDRNYDRSSLRFGGLRTMGPFPCQDSTIYLPTPADLMPGSIMQPMCMPAGAETNLPDPLRYAVAANIPPTKETTGGWISCTEFAKYLNGDTNARTVKTGELYDSETRAGVGIDANTHAKASGKFYQAQYLRLRKEIQLTAWATAEAIRFGQKANGEPGKDLLAEFASCGLSLRLGGQGGTATAAMQASRPLNIPAPAKGCLRLKWILLSPAIFNAGWLPGWIDAATGEIRLTFDKQPIAGRLVAARIPKPVTTSGWKLDTKGSSAGTPKATRLLAAAGSVYYFELTDAEAASRFVQALHLRPKSDLLGEKGFGLGAVGAWIF